VNLFCQGQNIYWNLGSIELGPNFVSIIDDKKYDFNKNSVFTFSILNLGYSTRNELLAISTSLIKGKDNGENDIAYLLPLDLTMNILRNSPWYLGCYGKYQHGNSQLSEESNYFETGIKGYLKTPASINTLYYSMINEIVFGINNRNEIFLNLKIDFGLLGLFVLWTKSNNTNRNY